MTNQSESELDVFRSFERAAHDTRAKTYYDAFSAVTNRAIEPLLDAAQVREGTKLLDVASGTGTLAGRAAQRSAIVVGFSAPERVLAEFARVLTPKGRVALSWWDGVGRLGGAEVCEPAQISLPVGGSESCLTRRCARLLQKPARGGYWQQ